MIDDILHSVEEAESKAAEIGRRAKEESTQIAADAKTQAEELLNKGKELFSLEAKEKRKLAEEAEAVADEEEQVSVLKRVEAIREDAKKKEAQIVSQLIEELIV